MTIETKRLELQAQLDSDRPDKFRNKLGQFATPTKLALEILTRAQQLRNCSEPVHFFDPALGTGAFYSALLETFPTHQIESAKGVEIDPYYGLPARELWNGTDLEIELADFTGLTPPPIKPNLIICNPPYVRHHHLGAADKKRLANSSAHSGLAAISGLAGLYCYFMVIAHKWLAEGGIAAWLIPSEFMDVNYGAALRRYLAEEVSLLEIHRFDPSDTQFQDALVSSAVVLFRKEKPRRDRSVKMSLGGSLLNPVTVRAVSMDELANSPKWSQLVNGSKSQSAGSHRLGDLFHIKRGLATGDNHFFVLSEEKCFELQLPKKFLQPVLPSPRYLSTDIVDADNEGLPLIEQRRFLIRCEIPEEEIDQESGTLAAYLASGRATVGETYLCRHRKLWFSQENRPAAPIVCTYMGRNLSNRAKPFRFILNHSKATALNVYLMLYPKRPLEQAINQNPEILHKVWEILNNIHPDTLLREGRVYGGGLYKLEPKELARVPANEIFALSTSSYEPSSQMEMFGLRVA